MKRRTSHATRSPFGLQRRRRGASDDTPLPDRLLGAMRFGGKSAFSLGLGALMLMFIGLLVANFIGQIMQSAALEARRDELAAEVTTMQAENANLEGAVAFTESDVYVERVAREQLGYAREGDTVILPQELLADAPVEPAADDDSAVPEAPAAPNWRLWWQALFPPSV